MQRQVTGVLPDHDAGQEPLGGERLLDGLRQQTPVHKQLRQEIAASGHLQTDDTPVTVPDRGGGSFRGCIWTAPALNSAVKLRRTRAGFVFSVAMDPIVATFPKVSTKLDQGHSGPFRIPFADRRAESDAELRSGHLSTAL